MTVPINPAAVDIFLQPGEVYFGDRDTRIRTVLGSCVSITFWHPLLLLGGMCHYMLPARGRPADEGLDGRYADEALDLLLAEMRAAGTHPRDYQAKLFGGGRMFAAAPAGAAQDIGARNVDTGRDLLSRHGLEPASEHLAGYGHRSIIFDVDSGDVWVRHVAELAGLHNAA